MSRRRLLAGLLLLAGAAGLGRGLYIPAKALLAQHLLARAWAATLAGRHHVKPWPWADTWPVARLTVPAEGVDLIVLSDASGRSLAFGPGHLPGSAAPGQAGNAVISGHRDTVFHFLRRLRPGEEVRLQVADGRVFRYRVRGHRVVDSRTTRLALGAGPPRLTLVTCYPFDALVPGGPERYLVFANLETKLDKAPVRARQARAMPVPPRPQ